MKKRIKIGERMPAQVFCFVLLAELAGRVFGDVYNYWTPTSGNWQVAANWSLGIVPTQPNVNPMYATVNTGTCNANANSGSDRLLIGNNVSGPVQPPTVNVDLGVDLHIRFELLFGLNGNSAGVLNLSGTAYAEKLRVGIGSGSQGTINVADGAVMTVGWWGCFIGESGQGTIRLKGSGSMVVYGNSATTEGYPGITMSPSGYIDIEAGVLKVYGDMRTQLQGYIGNGWISGYNGSGSVNPPFYDPTTGWTYVTAFPRFAVASQPSPQNGAQWVAWNTALIWMAGTGTPSHRVYFGTTSPGVFLGDYTTTSLNPGPLSAATTYYWRIDEVRGTNIVSGPVWSFTTRSYNDGLALHLTRGITLDRQFRQIPPESIMTITAADIQLIKSMGFKFVKLICNPAVFISGSNINTTNMWYLDEIVNRVVSKGLPVVVCIHPEADFKNTYLGNWANLQNLLGFYQAFADYMAQRWSTSQLAFQLMTEPFGNAWDWNTMQPLMWQAVRNGMPRHALILGGDQLALVEGLVNVVPVNDENVMYCFEGYEPFIFTFQGGNWAGGYEQYLRHVPYPSNPLLIAARMSDMLNDVPSNLQAQAQGDLTTYGSQYWNKTNLMNYRYRMALNWAITNGGRKLFVGEWGAYHSNAYLNERYQFIRDARELFDANNIGWAYWSYNETLTVLDPNMRVAFSKSPSNNWVDEAMLYALGLDNKDLAVRTTGTNAATVSWRSPSNGFALQQNTNLASTNWTPVAETVTDDGTNKFIIVSPPSGERFYRLFKP